MCALHKLLLSHENIGSDFVECQPGWRWCLAVHVQKHLVPLQRLGSLQLLEGVLHQCGHLQQYSKDGPQLMQPLLWTGQRWLPQAYMEGLRRCCLLFTGMWKNTATLLFCWKCGPEFGLSMAQPWTFALLRSDCFPVWQHASSTSGIMQGCMSLDIKLQALQSIHNVRYNRPSLQFPKLLCAAGALLQAQGHGAA